MATKKKSYSLPSTNKSVAVNFSQYNNTTPNKSVAPSPNLLASPNKSVAVDFSKYKSGTPAPFNIATAGPGVGGAVDYSKTNLGGSVLGASAGKSGGSNKSNPYPQPVYGTSQNAPRTISPTAANTSGFSSTNITGAAMAPTPSVSLPSAPSYADPGRINNGGLINGQTDYEIDPETGLFLVKQEQDAETQKSLNIQNMLQSMIEPKESASEDKAVQAQQQEVQQKKQIVADYTSQLNSVVAQQNVDLLNLRGIGSREGVTETVYGGQAATINREAAIKALPIQAALAGAQGNLELAQDYLTQLTSWTQEKIDNEYDYNMALYGSIEKFVTGSEKRRLDQMAEQKKLEREEKSANNKTRDEWVKIAVQNGQSDLVQRITAIDVASPTFAQDLALIQSRIVDASNARANASNARAAANAAGGGGSTLLSVSDAKALGVPYGTTRAQAIDMGITPGGSGGDYTFTTTQINTGAANAALDIDSFKNLDGEVKNFYINSKSLASSFKEALASVKKGDASSDTIKENIDSMDIPPTVKAYLTQQVDAVAETEQQGFLGGVWSSVKDYFGF